MSGSYAEKAAMESCKRANMTNAAIVIESLMQQRAYLLEALKEMWDAHEHNTSGRLSVMVIEAITRAAAQMQLDKDKENA